MGIRDSLLIQFQQLPLAAWREYAARDWGKPYWHPSSVSPIPDLVSRETFCSAVLCLSASHRDIGNRFLNTCIEQSGVPAHVYNLDNGRDRGALVLFHSYARWLMEGTLDRKLVESGAQAIADHCLERRRRDLGAQDSQVLLFYMQAVRAALISGNLHYARELLAVRYKFLWIHQRERELWTRLVKEVPAVSEAPKAHVEVTESLKDDIEALFDIIRNPDFQHLPGEDGVAFDRPMAALEFALIRELYLQGKAPAAEPDPKAVIEALAR